METYRVVSITDRKGNPRIEGRYPLRVGRMCKTSPTISTTFTFERPHSGHNYYFYLPIVAELISVSS